MKTLISAIVALTLITGCASSPNEITPTYVSPMMYDNYSCKQITEEMRRVTAQANKLAGILNKHENDDKVVMGVGLVLFWPSLFFIEGDGPQAQEYAHLKGEMTALEQAANRKNCRS